MTGPSRAMAVGAVAVLLALCGLVLPLASSVQARAAVGPSPSTRLAWLGVATPRPPRGSPTSPLTRGGRRTLHMSEKEGGNFNLFRNLQGMFRGKNVATKERLPQLPSVKAVEEALDDPAALDRLLQTHLPEHHGLQKGRLPNGLRYAILRNAAPAGRFEAYLEIFAGSADELDSQQGMAHIVEHISYMGSRKRERLFGTGSQTNAFTDFHHTVYFACCPVETMNLLGRPRPMLPMALDALSEVLEARFEESRLEKERAAILSEASMVNTMDYRVECQILSALHAENKLALRFPIGDEDLIKKWTLEDVKAFHKTHYRPDNAHLYIVGDVDVEQAEELIRKYFGHLESPPLAEEPEVSLKLQSRHFPPVAHVFSGGRFDRYAKGLPEELKNFGQDDGVRPLKPRIFQHENLQAFSFHLFAKRPVEAIKTLSDYRRSVMKRIAILALQIRLNVLARDDPPFTFIEFNQLDSPREACAVCNLDVLAEPGKWEAAVTLAVQEIRRLGLHGISKSEFDRYVTAMIRDATQHAAQGDRIQTNEQLNLLMETIACGHTFMEPTQQCDAIELVLKSITVDEVNAVAREICDHLANYNTADCPPPSACVATCPTYLRDRTTDQLVPFRITPDDILQVIEQAATAPLEASDKQDVEVPSTLMTPELEQAMVKRYKGSWIEDKNTVGFDGETGIHMKKLSNGVRFNYKVSHAESHRGCLSVRIPGGRMLEGERGIRPGAVAVGARTMQEGGALGPWSREQVELFCVDNLMIVEINANEDWICMDFTFPTTLSEEAFAAQTRSVSGLESIFQLVHLIFTDFKWEEDALMRAKKLYAQGHDMTINSLEGAGAEEMSRAMWNGDYRFLSIAREETENLTLDEVKYAISSQMTTDAVEISIVGDFEDKEVEDLALKYLGTIPPSKRTEPVKMHPLPKAVEDTSKRFTELHLPDSNARAFVYVSGRTPSRWGFMEGGATLGDYLMSVAPEADEPTRRRRQHPAFPFVSLLLIQEIMNRRLFSNIREKKQLTYDANFRWHPYDLYEGGWYSVQIAASPSSARQVLFACIQTFEELKSESPISHDNLDSAKKVIINKHNNEAQQNRYWTDLMAGIQLEACPTKGISFIRDLVPLVQSITVKDLQLVLNTVEMDESKICSCIAISEGGAAPPVAPPAISSSLPPHVLQQVQQHAGVSG